MKAFCQLHSFRLLCTAVCGAFMLLFLQSCSSFDDPVFCISIHKIVSPGSFAPRTMLIRPVSSYEGKDEVTISRFPLVDSSCFGDVQLVRGDNGKWGLRLSMDHRGQNLWREAQVENRSAKLAIVLDGFLVHTMDFPKTREAGIIMLPPIWRESEARQVAEHVVSNYKILNKF